MKSKEVYNYNRPIVPQVKVQVKQEVFAPSKQTTPVVCIVAPGKNVYSETFIRAHIEHLPTKVRVLYGGIPKGRLPSYRDDDQPLRLPIALPRRLVRRFKKKLLKLPDDYFAKTALKQFLLKNRVEVVLAEYGPTGVVMMDVCTEMGIPMVVHFHGYDAYHREVLQETGRRYPDLFKQVDAIVVVSQDMKNQLIHLGAPSEKIHYNPCGVDISLFHGANPDQALPTFVAVGRFVDKKAPHLTLLAFHKVLKTVPQAKLIMIGNGPLWEVCWQLSEALGMANAVEFLDVCPHHEVSAAMQRARAFVQHSIRTSYGDSEGTPVAVLEAGASGLPVVATRHAGIAEVVIEGETGLLVNEKDIENMAESMIRLGQDSALARQLGQAARKRICSEFSMEKSIDNLWSIIKQAIKKHRE